MFELKDRERQKQRGREGRDGEGGRKSGVECNIFLEEGRMHLEALLFYQFVHFMTLFG